MEFERIIDFISSSVSQSHIQSILLNSCVIEFNICNQFFSYFKFWR